MAAHYVYVDPVSGNDGTGAGNDTAATAATTPYKTLAAAVAGAVTAGENNRTSKAGAIHFRLLDGLDSYTPGTTTATINLDSGTWTTSETYPVKFYGYGSGIHDGNVNNTGTGAGFTLRRNVSDSGNTGAAFASNNVHWTFDDFRIIVNNTSGGDGTCIDCLDSYESTKIDRMLCRGISTGDTSIGIRLQGGSGSGRSSSVKNSVVLVDGGPAVYIDTYGNATILNNTLVTKSAANAALSCGQYADDTASTAKFNYARSNGGAAYGGYAGVWDAITRERNASADTTAYHATYDANGLNSIAYSTANFTNVTGGSEDLRLVVGSSLINAASTSSETVDVEGTARSTPDIGAYEYVGGDTTAPVLTSPTGSATSTTTATIGATTDEGNGTLYGVVTTSATQPSVAQIKAGNDHAGSSAAWSGSTAVSSTGAKTLSATGLTASTTYYGHLVHTDAAANDSNRVYTSSFVTNTKKLKLLAHSSAASATGVSGVVFAAPTGGNITGTEIGEFTGATFESSLDGSGFAVLKVAVSEFSGSSLAVNDTPVALVRNTTNTTGIISGLVIEE